MKIPKFLIFNFFTKQTIQNSNTFPLLSPRLRSIYLDLSFIIGLFFPFSVILFVPLFIQFAVQKTITNLSEIFIALIIIGTSFLYLILLNKDFYNGKSIGKRYFGYQVFDFHTNIPASEIKCMLRNITFIIWPIEILISFFNPSRRLGDMIANTKVIESNKEEPELILTEIKHKGQIKNRWKLLFISITISILYSILSILPALLILFKS
jgi:hypothetical protein